MRTRTTVDFWPCAAAAVGVRLEQPIGSLSCSFPSRVLYQKKEKEKHQRGLVSLVLQKLLVNGPVKQDQFCDALSSVTTHVSVVYFLCVACLLCAGAYGLCLCCPILPLLQGWHKHPSLLNTRADLGSWAANGGASKTLQNRVEGFRQGFNLRGDQQVTKSFGSAANCAHETRRGTGLRSTQFGYV